MAHFAFHPLVISYHISFFLFFSVSIPLFIIYRCMKMVLCLDLILLCLSLPILYIKYYISYVYVYISTSLLWTIIKRKMLLPTKHSYTHTSKYRKWKNTQAKEKDDFSKQIAISFASTKWDWTNQPENKIKNEREKIMLISLVDELLGNRMKRKLKRTRKKREKLETKYILRKNFFWIWRHTYMNFPVSRDYMLLMMTEEKKKQPEPMNIYQIFFPFISWANDNFNKWNYKVLQIWLHFISSIIVCGTGVCVQ